MMNDQERIDIQLLRQRLEKLAEDHEKLQHRFNNVLNERDLAREESAKHLHRVEQLERDLSSARHVHLVSQNLYLASMRELHNANKGIQRLKKRAGRFQAQYEQKRRAYDSLYPEYLVSHDQVTRIEKTCTAISGPSVATAHILAILKNPKYAAIRARTSQEPEPEAPSV